MIRWSSGNKQDILPFNIGVTSPDGSDVKPFFSISRLDEV